MRPLESLLFSAFHQKAFRVLLGCVAVWLLLSGWTGCGLRTRPHPIAPKLPGTKEVTIHQRDSQALVSWWLPAVALSEQAGGLKGFTLTVERWVAGCPACVPEATRTVWLPIDSPELVVEGPQAIYQFPLPEKPATWRVRLLTRFGTGEGNEPAVATMEGLAEIPTPRFVLEWVAPPQFENPPAVAPESDVPPDVAPRLKNPGKFRVFWPPQRERIVRILGEEGNMSAREEFFRANIYRRQPGRPWPWWPQNVHPLTAGQWESSPARFAEAGEELTVRFVDRFGNEGPAAPPVTITPYTGTP